MYDLGEGPISVKEMSLRDYFAAKAMQASITTMAAPWAFKDRGLANGVAVMAYDVADAMLAAREVKS